jgi:hypothetical protein
MALSAAKPRGPTINLYNPSARPRRNLCEGVLEKASSHSASTWLRDTWPLHAWGAFLVAAIGTFGLVLLTDIAGPDPERDPILGESHQDIVLACLALTWLGTPLPVALIGATRCVRSSRIRYVVKSAMFGFALNSVVGITVIALVAWSSFVGNP